LKSRISILASLLLAVLVSFSVQISKLNSATVVASTSNFEMVSAKYCLQTVPKISKSKAFGTPNFTAKITTEQPWQSSGLLIGTLRHQKRGDCYLAKLRMSPGFENSRIFFVAKLKSEARLVHSAGESAIDFIQARFLKAIRGVTPEAAGLVAGLSVGDTSRLSSEVIDKFKLLSLTHLTAVSGTNCAIVLGMVWLVLPRIRFGRLVVTRWPRLALAGVTLMAYESLVGFQPSVLRAGAMTFAVLLAKTLGRKVQATSALTVAVLVLLIVDPWLLFDYGFLLSVLACIGILIVAPFLAAWLRPKLSWLPSWAVLAASVSLSAQLLCFPVLLLLQPGFSTYSVLANLLAEPFVAPITVIGISAVVVAQISLPLAQVLTFTASLFAQPILWISDWLSEFPFVTGYWPSGAGGIALAVALAASLLGLARLKSGITRNLAVATSVGVFAVISAFSSVEGFRAATWANSRWFMVSCDVGQGDATVIRSRGLIAVVDVGREPKPIDSCLRQLGISQVDLLVLTHFDLDHVAGLAGLLGHRTVKLAMLTSFVDNRPGADAARRALDDRRVPIVEAETGLQGRLGSFRWQVLSPHLGAPEAEDSNDGSITMLWRSPKVDIITLADLGQKGQMRLGSESSSWMDAQLASVPLVMKVSHHGSADQSPGLIQALHPSLATVSVGRGNTYGHPTKRTLDLLNTLNCWVARTDEHGSIAIALDGDGFALGFQGEQGKTG